MHNIAKRPRTDTAVGKRDGAAGHGHLSRVGGCKDGDSAKSIRKHKQRLQRQHVASTRACFF
eukprot:9810294-Prorocentrum_lima.AAC.1